jgi:hypothetical protein
VIEVPVIEVPVIEVPVIEVGDKLTFTADLNGSP